MRILFSGVPAFGHLLPLLPLAREARWAGHDVAVLTNGDMAGPLGADLPVLAAGPAVPEVSGVDAALLDEVRLRPPGGTP